jgi:ABC-2 type transport system ATP-binding protein
VEIPGGIRPAGRIGARGVDSGADRLAAVAQGRVVAEGISDEPRRRYGGEAATAARTEPDGRPRAERTDLPTRTLAALRTRFDGEIPG